MCLHSISLNLSWHSGLRAYVGTGYKKILTSNLSKYNRIGRWTKASGDFGDPKSKLHKQFERADNNGYYHPGFHIWQNEIDANNYIYFNGGDIYEVLYKNVIAFGTNEVKYQETGYKLDYGPCIIAEYMKLVKKVG